MLKKELLNTGYATFKDGEKKYLVTLLDNVKDNITKEIIDFIKSNMAAMFEYIGDEYDGIVIFSDITSITNDEMMAITYHEIGHIINGDISGKSLAKDERIYAEIKADNYAKEKGYSASMRKFLCGLKSKLLKVKNVANEEEFEFILQSIDTRIELLAMA